MARLARVVAAGLAHHVTQRGNMRRSIFETDADRLIYLQLLDSNCQWSGVSVMGYCLMSNHVHLIVVPERAEALSLALRRAHGRYASYWNARHSTSGHVWQGRYYSCPLDTKHLWAALRYTECNPVRAGIVNAADRYRWSSAALHCGRTAEALPLSVDLETWQTAWNAQTWREFVDQPDVDEEAERLRASTHTGRQLGTSDFVKALEHTLHRSLQSRKGGRPRKQETHPAQARLAFP